MVYNIGQLEFKTKKAVVEHVMKIITKNVLGHIGVNHEDYKFFHDLIKNHSEYEIKNGVGINEFVIQPNYIYPQHFEMRLVRTDNTTDTFSWRHCCEFKPRTHIENLTKAMRESISDTIQSFRKTQNTRLCNLCSYVSSDYTDFAVDHDKIPFQVLRDDFLKITKIIIPTVLGSKQLTNETIFNDNETEFKNDWKKYHDEKATFQILCRWCNSKKSNN